MVMVFVTEIETLAKIENDAGVRHCFSRRDQVLLGGVPQHLNLGLEKLLTVHSSLGNFLDAWK